MRPVRRRLYSWPPARHGPAAPRILSRRSARGCVGAARQNGSERIAGVELGSGMASVMV
ncbi:hypothetical protein BD779DRAFT_1573412 [Infundibulicybe gibba]|nr:hypothetical protein BD779DRAFT_1573412 [Infundibulicybe gibba]